MTNREIENRIKEAFTNDVPDIFDKVLQSCEQPIEPQKVVVDPRTNKKRIGVKQIVSIAAAVVVIFALSFAAFSITSDGIVASVISIDVNPSIELQVNNKDKILKATPLNEDAKVVLGNMDLKGSDISVAVNALIGAMIRNGYIDELSNSILITVDNKNEKKGAELEKKLCDEISAILKSEDFDSEVISQILIKSKKIAQLAEEYGITSGKAQLIKQITDKEEKYSFKDLASLTIAQLNSILSGEKVELGLDKVQTEKNYIGKSKAKKITLNHAKLSSEEIFDYKCEMDYSNKKMIYKVTFKTDLDKYKYKINAESGRIIDSEVSRAFVGIQKGKEVAFEGAGTIEEEITDYSYWFDGERYYISFNIGLVKYRIEVDAVLGEIVAMAPKGQENPNVTVAYITESEAKRILLDQLSVAEEDIYDYSCVITKNGKIPVYELKCKKDYDIGIEKGVIDSTYIISALTGEVIGMNKDIIADETENQQTESVESVTGEQQEVINE